MSERPTRYPKLSPEALAKAYETGRVRGWAVIKTKDGVKFVERDMTLEMYQDLQKRSGD